MRKRDIILPNLATVFRFAKACEFVDARISDCNSARVVSSGFSREAEAEREPPPGTERVRRLEAEAGEPSR